MKAIRVHQFGPPEVLRYEDAPDPMPGAGEALVRVEVAGVNYADTLMRGGRYRQAQEFPFIPGIEVCGTVVELGEGVTGLSVGQRVMGFVRAGYAELVAAPAAWFIPLPEGVSVEEGAAFRVNFETAYHCLHTCARVVPGETVLVHAAGGGVGTAAVQLAKVMGARVIATASSDDKLAQVKELGADDLINYATTDFEAEVNRLTDGRGADVILESVGGEVFRKSLGCLAPLGRLIVYGIASGNTGSVQGGRLLFANQCVFGFHLGNLRATRMDVLQAGAAKLLVWLRAGKIRPIIGHRFPLSAAAAAHALMESRGNYGKIVLMVNS